MIKRLARLFRAQLPPFFQPGDEPEVREGSIVVAHNPTVRAVGHAILDSGGNAFDAFVAVTVAQNVMAEGASSLAGPLGVLLRRASTGEVAYLDADFNDPISDEWRWSPRMPKDGRAVLVPGAPAGLEALVETHCTWPLSALVQPGIQLAEEGFTVSRLLASFIKWRAAVLKRSEHGRTTFFAGDGTPLQAGDTIRQPAVATFLESLGREGASYVYSGAWGGELLSFVRARNGVLTVDDLDNYTVRWDSPIATTYRGYALCCPGGRTYGGAWTLLALKMLERVDLSAAPHYSTDAGLLELVVRIARLVWSEGWLLDHHVLDDRRFVQFLLAEDHVDELWARLLGDMGTPSIPLMRPHSYQIIVVDREGNVVNGTTTIESDPWGEGFFVEGVPLSTAGTAPWSTANGQRRLSPFSMHFAFEGDHLRFASGGISNSVVEAEFQFLVNLIDYGLGVGEAVSMPRFGTFPAKRKLAIDRNWLDPRVDDDIVKSLKGRLRFERDGLVDTGSGAVVAIDPRGILAGAPAPLPFLPDPFATEA
jgi:gamma-glutamyltranspeptidase/glutathione hydrolase